MEWAAQIQHGCVPDQARSLLICGVEDRVVPDVARMSA